MAHRKQEVDEGKGLKQRRMGDEVIWGQIKWLKIL